MERGGGALQRKTGRPGQPSGPKARAEATSTVTVVESGTCAAARTRQKPVPKWRLGTANSGSAGPTARRHSGIPTRPAALGNPPRRSVTWPPKGRRPDRTGKPYNSDPPHRGRANVPAPPRAPECARRRLPTSKLVRRAAVFRGRPGMATGPKMSRRRGRGPRGHPAGGPARAWGLPVRAFKSVSEHAAAHGGDVLEREDGEGVPHQACEVVPDLAVRQAAQ